MNSLDDQLKLFEDDDAMDWHAWFMSLPLTPPSQPRLLPDRPKLFPEPSPRRRAA